MVVLPLRQLLGLHRLPVRLWQCRAEPLRTYRTVATKCELIPFGTGAPVVEQGDYPVGQFFVHKVFAVRGVVLFPWTTRVVEDDPEASSQQQASVSGNLNRFTATGGRANPDAKPNTRTCYLVLIDDGDMKKGARWWHDSMTYLQGPRNEFYTVDGLENVQHDDIYPYYPLADGPQPITHDLFHRFLSKDTPSDVNKLSYVEGSQLAAYRERILPLLRLSDTYVRWTDRIKVTVIPYYVGCKTKKGTLESTHVWRYSIRIENFDDTAVTVRHTILKVFAKSPSLKKENEPGVDSIKHNGIFNHQPCLSPEKPALQFSSHIEMRAEAARVWGYFVMEWDNCSGRQFECKVGPFWLVSPQSEANFPIIHL